MKVTKSFSVEINGWSKGAVVSIEEEEVELFELLGSGLQIRERQRPPGVLVDPAAPPKRNFRVSSSEIGDKFFDEKLSIVLERGFRPEAPGGEVPDELCFQLSETREYTAKELAHAEFLSVDTQVSSFILA